MTTPSTEYRLIPLSKGQFAKVSAHRYDALMRVRWWALWCASNRKYYAIRKGRKNGKYIVIFMHRHILGLEYGDPREGDHIDRDSLNNTDENLRIVNDEEQSRNHSKRRDNKTGYIGVQFYKKLNKVGARIRVHGKCIHLGVFSMDQIEMAAKVRDAAAKRFFGEHAHLNFPNSSEIDYSLTKFRLRGSKSRKVQDFPPDS